MTEAIIFDFDGVILNSNGVKDEGFRTLFSEFDSDSVDSLIAFHKANGGLSRFVKIRHMFENILKQSINDEIVAKYADRFSEIMLKQLQDPSFIIDDTMTFIKQYSSLFKMHIASGTEENELRTIVKSIGIGGYFKSVYGSPAPKPKIVGRIIAENGYDPANCIMIGDSHVDHEAAAQNGIRFCGFNNDRLADVSDFYITGFNTFKSYLGLA